MEAAGALSWSSRPSSVRCTSHGRCWATIPTGGSGRAGVVRGVEAKTAAAMTPTIARGIPANISTASTVFIGAPHGARCRTARWHGTPSVEASTKCRRWRLGTPSGARVPASVTTTVHVDHASGAKASRPQLDLVFQLLRTGDTLVTTRVTTLDRRWVLHLVTLRAELREHGIGLRVVDFRTAATPAGRRLGVRRGRGRQQSDQQRDADHRNPAHRVLRRLGRSTDRRALRPGSYGPGSYGPGSAGTWGRRAGDRRGSVEHADAAYSQGTRPVSRA